MKKMTNEVFEKICLDLEESWQGLSIICKRYDIQSRQTFLTFKDKTKERQDRYVRARENQLDYLEELLREVSFQDGKDNTVTDKVNVGSNAIARDRLRADTLKFILGKLRSNKWGNKLDVTQTVTHVPIFGSNPLDA